MNVVVVYPISTILSCLAFYGVAILLGIEGVTSGINSRAAHDFADNNTLSVLIIIGIICIISAIVLIKVYKKLCQGSLLLIIAYSICTSFAIFFSLEAVYNISLHIVDGIVEFLTFSPLIILLLFIPYFAFAFLYLILMVLIASPPILTIVGMHTYGKKNSDYPKSFLFGILLSIVIIILYLCAHPQYEFQNCVSNLIF